MSQMEAGIGIDDSILLNSIIQATAEDQNLSQLPEEFKDEAIRIMFHEAKLRREGSFIEPCDGCPGEEVHKRARPTLDEEDVSMEE
tara:strand:- start:166 stop:423 length:258 start_codon:yes stop_codon:yes gene_type:complete